MAFYPHIPLPFQVFPGYTDLQENPVWFLYEGSVVMPLLMQKYSHRLPAA